MWLETHGGPPLSRSRSRPSSFSPSHRPNSTLSFPTPFNLLFEGRLQQWAAIHQAILDHEEIEGFDEVIYSRVASLNGKHAELDARVATDRNDFWSKAASIKATLRAVNEERGFNAAAELVNN